jgi:hypothetical protein
MHRNFAIESCSQNNGRGISEEKQLYLHLLEGLIFRSIVGRVDFVSLNGGHCVRATDDFELRETDFREATETQSSHVEHAPHCADLCLLRRFFQHRYDLNQTAKTEIILSRCTIL